MKLALAQTNIKWEDKIYNLNFAEKYIIEAKNKNVDFILFPEMSFTGFSFNVNILGENDNFTIDKVKFLSNKYNIYIGFGYVEKCTYNSKIMGKNKYIIIYKNNILSEYTKIHPFSYSNENNFFISGDHISSTKIKDISISTLICYDLRFPEIFQIASTECTLITVAANWPSKRIEHFKTLLKARAIENQCYIAGINRTGSDPNLIYNGCSCIIDPFGNELASLYNLEGLLISDINIDIALNLRKTFALKNDRKNELYYKLSLNNYKKG